MSLSKYTDFSHLARDLFFHTVGINFRNGHDGFDVRDALPIVDEMSLYCIAFSNIYFLEFRGVFVQAEYDEFKTEEQFLRYVIPRCLNIVLPENYFYSLLLVSAFLKEFIDFLWESRRCDRFHMAAYKGYVAVFKRAFESSFESHGGMEGLEEYLEELKRSVPRAGKDMTVEETRKLRDMHYPIQVRSVIYRCCPVHDDFVLNEFERSLLAIDRVDEILNEDSDLEHEDPLGFEWPIRPEQVKRILEFDLYEYDDIIGDDENTDLCNYANALELKALVMMEPNEFDKKIKNRMCPCCGVRCFLFSSALFDKQLALSLKRTPRWKKYLLRFIWKCQKRIAWLIQFSLIIRRELAVTFPFY